MIIEICAGSAESGVIAQEAGASRIELCAVLSEGGITPSFGEIKCAKTALDIDINVLIRPRSGDFVYSSRELEIMKDDISVAKVWGVNGVVFGCLTETGTVDVNAMEYLMSNCQGLSVTFHRAFDMCENPSAALEQIVALGCDRILTSGGEKNAWAGREMIREINHKAADRIIVMPGGGIALDHVVELVEYTGVREIHLSASIAAPVKPQYSSKEIRFGNNPAISSRKKIEEIIQKLQKFGM